MKKAAQVGPPRSNERKPKAARVLLQVLYIEVVRATRQWWTKGAQGRQHNRAAVVRTSDRHRATADHVTANNDAAVVPHIRSYLSPYSLLLSTLHGVFIFCSEVYKSRLFILLDTETRERVPRLRSVLYCTSCHTELFELFTSYK